MTLAIALFTLINFSQSQPRGSFTQVHKLGDAVPKGATLTRGERFNWLDPLHFAWEFALLKVPTNFSQRATTFSCTLEPLQLIKRFDFPTHIVAPICVMPYTLKYKSLGVSSKTVQMQTRQSVSSPDRRCCFCNTWWFPFEYSNRQCVRVGLTPNRPFNVRLTGTSPTTTHGVSSCSHLARHIVLKAVGLGFQTYRLFTSELHNHNKITEIFPRRQWS